jgi:hypothetical protein
MPKDRFAVDFNHWLWAVIGFFGEPSSHTTCEDNSFHWVTWVQFLKLKDA